MVITPSKKDITNDVLRNKQTEGELISFSSKQKLELKQLEKLSKAGKEFVKKVSKIILDSSFDIDAEDDPNIIKYYRAWRFIPVFWCMTSPSCEILTRSEKKDYMETFKKLTDPTMVSINRC